MNKKNKTNIYTKGVLMSIKKTKRNRATGANKTKIKFNIIMKFVVANESLLLLACLHARRLKILK